VRCSGWRWRAERRCFGIHPSLNNFLRHTATADPTSTEMLVRDRSLNEFCMNLSSIERHRGEDACLLTGSSQLERNAKAPDLHLSVCPLLWLIFQSSSSSAQDRRHDAEDRFSLATLASSSIFLALAAASFALLTFRVSLASRSASLTAAFPGANATAVGSEDKEHNSVRQRTGETERREEGGKGGDTFLVRLDGLIQATHAGQDAAPSTPTLFP
jgi:hypothetical protein